jgi:hypothetical protein
MVETVYQARIARALVIVVGTTAAPTNPITLLLLVFVSSDPRSQVGRSPKQAGPFRLGYNPGKQSRRQKTPRYSKTSIHPSAQPLAEIIPAVYAPGATPGSRPVYSGPNGTLPGTGIFLPETAAENWTHPRTETANHKTTVRKPRQRRAFPISLYRMTKQQTGWWRTQSDANRSPLRFSS